MQFNILETQNYMTNEPLVTHDKEPLKFTSFAINTTNIAHMMVDTNSCDTFEDRVIESIVHEISSNDQCREWMNDLKLRCREYIKHNGVKTVTIEEIWDVLRDQAFSTFPKNVELQLNEDFG